MITTQVIGMYLFYIRHWYSVSSHMSSSVTRELKLLVDEFNFDRNNVKSQEIADYLGFTIEFCPNEDLTNIKKFRREEFANFQDMLGDEIPFISAVDYLRNQNIVEVAFDLGDGVFKVQMSSKRIITPTTHIFMLWVIAVTGLLLSVAIIFSKNQIRSILALTNVADKFGRGINDDKFKPTGAYEIRLAGLAFLRMKSKLERQISKRTNLLAMFSHDLKTPITRMKLHIATQPESEDNSELLNDLKDMEVMVNSYLDFARGEGGEDFHQIKIAKFIDEIIHNNYFGELKIKINRPGRDFIVNIKPHSFTRAVLNIINNAMRFAYRLDITILLENDDEVVILFEDDGIGISDDDKQKVFEPFFRADKSRNINKQGSVGLGLAITHEVVIGNNGTIRLKNGKILGGLLIKITLPLFEDKN